MSTLAITSSFNIVLRVTACAALNQTRYLEKFAVIFYVGAAEVLQRGGLPRFPVKSDEVC